MDKYEPIKIEFWVNKNVGGKPLHMSTQSYGDVTQWMEDMQNIGLWKDLLYARINNKEYTKDMLVEAWTNFFV